VFAYVDEICNRLVPEYRSARERWARTPEAIRAETVRAIIDGTLDNPRDASRLLGHELERRHHLGLVIWESQPNGSRHPHTLERAASAVADAVGMNEPLLVPTGGSELWAWLSALEQPDAERLDAAPAPDLPPGVRAAIGRPAVGIDGFRASHLEAVSASRVAVLAGADAPSTTRYDDVELVALLSADIERARAFVVYELGALAGMEPAIARLRETMLVLLEEGMSNSRAAQRLYVHHNTVVYRTARAKELLGHGLVERRIQLTAALMLARTLGEAVLPGHSG
jgi:DNA-binding PucR family transcriptional regulator